MCTRANRASVPDSLHALASSLIGLTTALLALLVALATAPVRLVRRGTRRWSPTSTSHIEVQVYSDDRKRVREIRRSCRAALQWAARTWAPYPLPLDRVEVFASAPPLGRTDIYARWVHDASVEVTWPLVVVSLGTVRDQRPLTADEIAGALAGQIELLVADRYRREQDQEQASASAVGMLERKPDVGPDHGTESAAPASDTTPADNVVELSSVRALLADMKRSQPLQSAGSSQNGVHPDPNPA
jgi:hypothetical protein